MQHAACGTPTWHEPPTVMAARAASVRVRTTSATRLTSASVNCLSTTSLTSQCPTGRSPATLPWGRWPGSVEPYWIEPAEPVTPTRQTVGPGGARRASDDDRLSLTLSESAGIDVVITMFNRDWIVPKLSPGDEAEGGANHTISPWNRRHRDTLKRRDLCLLVHYAAANAHQRDEE